MSINNQMNVSNRQSQVAQMQALRAQQFNQSANTSTQCCWPARPNLGQMQNTQPQENLIKSLVEGMMKAFMSVLEKLIPALQGGANGSNGVKEQPAPSTDPASTAAPENAAPVANEPIENGAPVETAPVATEQAVETQKLEEEQAAQETSTQNAEATEPKNPIENFLNTLKEGAGDLIGGLIGQALEGTKGPRRALRKVRKALRQVGNLLKPKNLKSIFSMAQNFFGLGGVAK